MTATKNHNAEVSAKMDAIDRAQAVIEFELDGTIITANNNFLTTVGYSLEEIQGKHHRLFCEETYANSPEYGEFWETLRSGECVLGEFRRLGKDGQELWLNASYNPVFDANGQLAKVVKFATDVTDQVFIQKEAEKLSLVANETDNSVIICDSNGAIEYCNPGFSKLTGYSNEEALGRNTLDLLSGPRTDSETIKRIREQIESQEVVCEEILNYKKSGEAYWVSLAVSPVLNSDGKLAKLVEVQTDITEVKLQQMEFSTKIDAISKSNAIIEFKPDGTIITANEIFLNTMGYRLDEIQGAHHRIFCDPDEAASSEYRWFWEKLARGEFDSGKYKRLNRQGESVYLNASYNPILDQEGKVVKVVKFGTDITAQVEIEKEVTEIANEFAKSAEEISSRAKTVASGTQSLGATTEQMNASVEELSASIDSIASNGKSADDLAKSTQMEAEQGTKAIANSIESMERINSSAEQISDIVKVISDIANRTNLLAFNAAIEAARAGEHGLGFSVVADEVRKLAEKSSDATNDISKLINESVKRVSQGSEISKEAAASFEKIVEGVRKTTEAISDISAAAQEQQIASKEVAHAIQHVADATEDSACASEAIANSTTELAAGSKKLQQAVERFSK